MTSTPQSSGGRASAILNRLKAERSYYESPSLCAHCEEVIHPQPGIKLQRTRRKKFCDSKCAALHNNQKKGARAPLVISCGRCSKPFTFSPSRGSKSRRYCDECKIAAALASKGLESLPQRTKESLKNSSASYQSWRSAIQRHAGVIFGASGRPAACAVCGYSLHVQVAHLTAVAAFPPSATVAEINAIENLIALCPNHHWELDHGELKLS